VRLFGCVLAASAFLACAAPPSALDGPTQAVVAQDGLVYVADGYFHARIAVFTPSGSFVRDWGSKGFEQGQLQTPHSLLEARDGTLVVADRDNGRLQRFGTSGEFVESVRSDVIGRPWSVAQTPEGHLFVADGGDQRPDAERAGIVELTASGDVLRRFSRFGSAPGELDEPHMLATAENGDVFVAEIGARRVQRFALRADCEASDPACAYENVAGWPALEATPGLDPLSIAVAGDRVYVGHQGQHPSIWVLERATGIRQSVLGENLFERPHGLFVAADGTLWVADDRGNRVYHLTTDGKSLGVLGEP